MEHDQNPVQLRALLLVVLTIRVLLPEYWLQSANMTAIREIRKVVSSPLFQEQVKLIKY
jgi:hypothetical protein